MISPRQIRAARGLLDWDATELGKHTNLSRETIANIESGRTQAREGSLEKIAKVFDENGVEFTANDGVRLKPRNTETFEGPSRFDEFYDFIFEHLKNEGGDICIYGHNAKLFYKYRKDPDLHRRRMMQLLKDRPTFSVRTMNEHGDGHMPNAAFSTYKWQKKEHFPPTSFYVFGSCVALISFDGAAPPYVILIKSPLFAEAYRRYFDLAWDLAENPPLPQK